MEGGSLVSPNDQGLPNAPRQPPQVPPPPVQPPLPQPGPPTARPPQPASRKQPALHADVTQPVRRGKKKSRRFWRRRSSSLAPGQLLAEREKARRELPAWLTSLVFHLLLLLILALIPFANGQRGALTLWFSQGGADGLAEFELVGGGVEDSVTPVTSEAFELSDLVPDPSELLSVTVADAGATLEPQPTVLANLPFGIARGLAGRTGASKQGLLSKYGGTAETEQAVELGLKWLVKQQRPNGSWSLKEPYENGGANENTTAATAMALNAFLGAGYTHLDGKYADVVKKGLDYLTRRQDSDGFFSTREPTPQQMYAQALATIAVTEAYGMTDDEELRSAAGKALSFAEWAQSDLRGWRYNPREDADLSVTGWFVMALETGKMAGLPVDEEKLQLVTTFLDSVAYKDQSQYAYNTFKPPSLTMTAEGLLCRIYLGWPRSHPALLAAVERDLLPARPQLEETDRSAYYWYYATQVLHHIGGPPWDEWNQAMKATLPALQVTEGDAAGSWDPSADIHSSSGGRLFTTCFCIYCLEVYYRHLSIYDVN